MTIWGVVSTAQSAVHSFGSLLACRIMLGIAEAPFFPGAIMLMSSWYTRQELSHRIAWFYSGSALANMFGGVLGAVPVWFATFLVSLLVTWTSGKTGDRSIHIICLMLVSAVGNAIATGTTQTGARFFAMFLMPMGAVSAYQIIVAWVANTIAICNMFGNTASIYGSYMYPKSAGPRYIPGGSANAVICLLVAIFAVILRFVHIRENKKLEMVEAEAMGEYEGDNGRERTHASTTVEQVDTAVPKADYNKVAVHTALESAVHTAYSVPTHSAAVASHAPQDYASAELLNSVS
ncbi:putative Uncharacterized transporter [Glarea lozoyensis 74030]|uniref:Putative Uncharacterized transporter n=1 Tax=Glarea lozoyensis (strain ATCC 74030 / MF5533) TaxID=1104152 RepID=H0ESC6_GLAL7|nr:putative Uncharacterized transporter [Glarea lozoyensis 74030]